MKTILFLCTGNYYRSRFAEIFFNWHAQQQGLVWTATSRGLGLDYQNPGPMSRHTLARLAELSVPTEKYLRFPIAATANDFLASHRIIAVNETEHRPMMERKFPAHLSLVEFWEVHDLDCVGPEVAIPHLEREVAALLEQLKGT